MNLTFNVQIDNIPDDYFSDDCYSITMLFVNKKLQEIADGLEGHLKDVEMK